MKQKWKLEPGSFMPRINGQAFRCDCGCNVFGKVVDQQIYICNACGTEYEGEPK